MKKAIFDKILANALVKNQYETQLKRVKKKGDQTEMIEAAVNDVMRKLPNSSNASLVVYGDPQSGKTEMMICLTAALLDKKHNTIIHLMNDSVDLMMQNLDRFKLAGLAPAPRNSSDLANSALVPGHPAIIFCKKNSKDLRRLIDDLKYSGPIIVIDDEADYATPNSKINNFDKTKINDLVAELLGKRGKYIGVTATPARLNLNNTFNNRTETWVNFRPHDAYTGQDVFFPSVGSPKYRLNLLKGPGTALDSRKALARFLVTVAFLNLSSLEKGNLEENYSFLVHTSGKMSDHKIDRDVIESAMKTLVSAKGKNFESLLALIHEEAQKLYPDSDAAKLTSYVLANASRSSFVVLNSKRNKASAGDKPTVPTCPFTVIIGGNIVSRGVTFPNLLSMYFTRDVRTKLQQDTYIQRARMFGARGKYLQYFELTIPETLYADWHRCFVFHRLALETIKNDKKSPVWIYDRRISVAANTSIDRGTVDVDRGEMSFQIFNCPDPKALDNIVAVNPKSIETVRNLANAIGEAFPEFLVKYLDAALKTRPGTLAIHSSSSIAGQKSADQDSISRAKKFIGKSQLEENKFPNAIHHVKIFHNAKGKARVFYKNTSGVQFIQNLK